VVVRKKAAVVRGTPGPLGVTATEDFLFAEMSSNSALFDLECLVFDKVSWSNTPVFHNTLVVGSSPTGSTTQSPLKRLFVDYIPSYLTAEPEKRTDSGYRSFELAGCLTTGCRGSA